MTGLDKILEEINSEAKENSDKIISQAEEQAELITNAAHDEADVKYREIISGAEKEAADIISRGESSASLEESRSALSAKQSVITKMLSNALEHIKSLNSEEYFSLILKLAEKNSLTEEGRIAFSAEDLSRLPKNFEEKVNSVSKGKLTVSDEPANIKSGFVLIYGGIEENCSFEAIFRSKQEELTDRISQLLFKN